MLAGHYAPALALKRYTDGRGWGVPLWALCVGVQAVDIGFMVLVLAGVELGATDNAHVPHFTVVHGQYTHSLAMTVVYGVLAFGGAYAWQARRAPPVGAPTGLGPSPAGLGVVAALAVVSHWLGDLVVHVPDLPVGLADTPAVGLGLWRWPLAATVLEIGLVAVTAGRFRLLAGALVAVQIANDLVLPLDENQALLAVKALGLYAGVAALAWWSERRSGGASRGV